MIGRHNEEKLGGGRQQRLKGRELSVVLSRGPVHQRARFTQSPALHIVPDHLVEAQNTMGLRFWETSSSTPAPAPAPAPGEAAGGAYASDSSSDIVYDGDLAFTRVKGGNGSEATYQEAVGAPVERNSPLGYHVGWVTIIFLNVNQMIGTGIFSTRQSPGSTRHPFPPESH